MDVLTWTPEFLIENESLCRSHLENAGTWNEIPSINCCELHELRDNGLVRFRGMIQDMYNPEYFFEKFEVENEVKNERCVKNGKYRDSSRLLEHETIIYDSEKNVTSARQTFVLISLPGINLWVDNAERETYKTVKLPNCDNSARKSMKRELDDEEMQVDEVSASNSQVNNKPDVKKHCNSTEAGPSAPVVSREHILNFPLSEENGKCCHIKIYTDTDSFKLNEMIDVVGFLSLDPLLSESSHDNGEEGSQMEIQTHHPPPSLVPRIHCVTYRRLNDCNPLTDRFPLSVDNLQSLRKDLLLVLTQLLFGDELAAEYLLCNLVSTVYLRKDLLALGKFALNISNVPAVKYTNYGQELYDILQLFLVKSHYLAMTLENMNTLSFIPKKDYECDRLTSGVLQLSSNTHFFLDETRLQTGKLNESGCRGIQALSDAIIHQRVNYDFNYYKMEYDCNIVFVVLSEGKSLLPSDVHVPLNLDDHCVETFPEIVSAAKHFLKPELLNNLRVYLSNVRHSTYELPNDTMELIQNEFVQMRQSSKTTGDDLHHLLVLARLLCLSSGKSSLDEEFWHKACEMEAKRKERIIQQKS